LIAEVPARPLDLGVQVFGGHEPQRGELMTVVAVPALSRVPPPAPRQLHQRMLVLAISSRHNSPSPTLGLHCIR